jgi:hypothetical protein
MRLMVLALTSIACTTFGALAAYHAYRLPRYSSKLETIAGISLMGGLSVLGWALAHNFMFEAQ